MPQSFPDFDYGPGGDDVRTALINLRSQNLTLQSNFEGTSFPTPVPGQTCWRSDESKLYLCTTTAPSPSWSEIAVGVVPIALGGSGSTTASDARTAFGLGNVSTFNAASQAEAQAGASSTTLMTPQRTAQAIDALAAKVRITSNDTTPKYLYSALVAGNGVTLTEQNDGSNETLRIDASGAETGDTCYSYRTSKSGWVLQDGKTIGSSLSGASSRANSDTQSLFELLWALNSTIFPIYDSSGTLTTRGASAASDFAANKAITLPDERGRTSVGRDDMGGTAANRLTTGGSGIDGTVLGSSGGAETHVLTISQIPPHTHSVSGSNNASSNNGSGTIAAAGSRTTGSTGGGAAHNNTQPSIVKNAFIKL